MQGIFIDGRRPKSKKEIKEVCALDPSRVSLEATSLIASDEYDGPVANAPRNKRFGFVGPDPYTKRNFYGNITVQDGGKVVVV